MQKESIRSIFLKTAEHDRTTDVTRKELFDMTFVCRLKNTTYFLLNEKKINGSFNFKVCPNQMWQHG